MTEATTTEELAEKLPGIEQGSQVRVGSQVVHVAKASTQLQLDQSARLGMWLAAAESESKDPNAKGMAAALRIEYCRWLGLPPHAAAEVYVIKGNLTLSTKLLRAMAYERGLLVKNVEEDDQHVTAAVIRVSDGVELGRSTFTMAEAIKAGLPSKPGENWKVRPHRMLWARAAKRALDDHAPWVTVGVMTTDEAEDIDLVPQPFESDVVLEGTIEDDE